MATVTTNFNFPIPQSTDLVKDGATAIAALGTSVDTQFVDLKGGTTGQVLAKASGTDMDFSWVAQDDSNAIQNAIVDAKGDLIAASAADTPARLAVGNNGEILVPDSSTSTGLRWQPNQTAGKNKILNSDMSIAQRGTSISVGSASWNTYTLDRYKCYSGNTATTVSRDTSAPTGFSYSLKLQRPNGNTGTNSIIIGQIIETANCMPLQGQYVTFSFWIKKGANYSGGNVAVQLLTGTGTDQGGDPYGWTGLTAAINDSSYSPTTSFVRIAYNCTLPSTAKELAVLINYTGSGTAGADDAIYITGVQLEAGAVTSYQSATATYSTELAACQRYLPAIAASNGEIYTGQAYSTTAALVPVIFPVTARVAPTGITVNSAGNFRLRSAVATKLTTTSINFSTGTVQGSTIEGIVSAGLVAGNATNLFNESAGTILFTGCEL